MMDPKPTRKQKPKETKSQPVQSGAERLKAVVRRLPPNLPEDIFWQSVHEWVSEETVAWKSYHPGKLRTKRSNKEGVPSRAYIAFKSETQVATFSRAYDGHVFRDKAGNESYAVVEYAPFQKVPYTEKKKVDARNNTIDKDEDYLSFLETLKGGAKAESVSLEALIAASQPSPPPTTTPLLEALKAEKSAQKDKETILRNHAHYKDPVVSGSVSKKEDTKRKAAAAAAAAAAVVTAGSGGGLPVQAAKPESPASTSKKAKRTAAAAHKATSQEGHGKVPTASGAAAVPPSSATKPTPTPASSGGRPRPPRESHGRSHSGKGDEASGAASVPTSVPAVTAAASGQPPPLASSAENVPTGSPAGGPPGPGQRKNRPVVGLGRHFEAALSGAGVAVSAGPGAPGPGGERKRRDRGGESGAGAGPGSGPTEGSGGGASKQGKQKHREERPHAPLEVVPSILQRPAEAASPDVAIVHRPLTPRGTEGSGGHGEGVPGRGGGRRGRGRGRGRGG